VALAALSVAEFGLKDFMRLHFVAFTQADEYGLDQCVRLEETSLDMHLPRRSGDTSEVSSLTCLLRLNTSAMDKQPVVFGS
jgi:hypothetical protein